MDTHELSIEKFPHCCGVGILARIEMMSLEDLKEQILIGKYYGYDIWMRNGEWKDTKRIRTNTKNFPLPPDEDYDDTGWGSLLAVTSPGQNQQVAMFKACGFEEVAKTVNPVYGDPTHKMRIWHLDLTKVDPKKLAEVKLNTNKI